MRRLLSGSLAAGATLGMLGLSMYVVNVSARSWASYRLAQSPENLTAEAILFGF